MRRLKKIFFCLVLVLSLQVSQLKSQNILSVTVEGHILAEVIPVFAATETAQMNFGRFSPGPQGGSIILTPENSISVLGSIYKGLGTYNAASFYISGDSNAAFTITLPSSPVVLKHESSSKTMLIQDWISNPGQGVGNGILQNGEQTVQIGATLKVGTIQDNPVGVYAGTYTVTFDFN